MIKPHSCDVMMVLNLRLWQYFVIKCSRNCDRLRCSVNHNNNMSYYFFDGYDMWYIWYNADLDKTYFPLYGQNNVHLGK